VLDQYLSKNKIKKSRQAFRNGSKQVNFFPAPKLTSVFAPFCDFQTTIDAYGA
jgi:hypothetical protein